ncbi:ComF family protein [bacterium]|nr:ComF family protein [bacterium]
MEIPAIIKRTGRDLLNFVYPPFCILCDQYLEEGDDLICFNCLSNLDWLPFAYCPDRNCNMIVPSDLEGCPVDGHKGIHLKFIRALGNFNQYAGDNIGEPYSMLIHELKYNHKHSVARILGSILGRIIDIEPHFKDYEAFIPTPLHSTRRRERGYNQSELIADVLSKSTGKPVLKGLVRRKRHTKSQTTLSRLERKKNISGAFEVTDKTKVQGRSLLLVDDVYTTGSTLNEIALVLNDAGASKIAGVTLAIAMNLSIIPEDKV